MSESDSPNGGEDADPGSNGNMQQKCCWVCYANESDDTIASWVQPCNCKGTSKWVHQACLQRWVDEMQKGNFNRKVSCPQCKAEYLLVFPSMGPFVTFLDTVEEVTHKVCPFVAGGVMLGSIYWSAITFGSVTVMQVVGHREGLEMLEAADPLVLLLLLPAVPVVLVCARALRWEDALLLALRRTCRKLPLLTIFLPFGEIEREQSGFRPVDQASSSEDPNTAVVLQSHTSPTRILCGALILPTISTIMGRVFFSSVRNNFHRTILGGLTFIVVKGALNIYHKQKLYIRQSTRKILDYNPENLRLFAHRNIISDVRLNARPGASNGGSDRSLAADEPGIYISESRLV